MQYKIPVQIENEDPIVFNLSLRQLAIIVRWWWIAYGIFKKLQPTVWAEIRAIPSLIVLGIALIVALFKQYEMTFLPFMLALLRFNINFKERYWVKWIDSFWLLDTWIISISEKKDEKNIDFKDKLNKLENLEEKLKKI